MASTSRLTGRLGKRREPKPNGESSSLKTTVDLLISTMTALFRFALFIGFLALAAYLGAAQHVVTGTNLTDAFLLAALALALGFLALVLVLAGALLIGAQVGFIVSFVARGLTTDHLHVRQRRWIPAFALSVAVYTIGIPSMYLEVLQLNDWKIWPLLAGNLLAAGGLGWWWERVQALCERPSATGSSEKSTSDALGDGFGTAGVLFMSSLAWAFLSAALDGKVVVLVVLGGFSAAGFCIAFARGSRVTPGWTRVGKTVMGFTLAVSVFVSLFFHAFGGNTGVAKAFQIVGLNVPNATIDVSAANLQRLERAAVRHGLPIETCRHADGSATLTNVRILWHTLGNSGLVELWSEPTNPAVPSGQHPQRFQTSPYEQFFGLLGWRGVRVPLENSGLVVTTGSNIRCMELDGLHFASNSSFMSQEATQDLVKQLEALKASIDEHKRRDGASVEKPVRLQITGHADPRKRQHGTNEDLAKIRAEAVRQVVQTWVSKEAPQWESLTITVSSEGARSQVRKCDGLDSAESEACNAFNRRVVLQLTTAPNT